MRTAIAAIVALAAGLGAASMLGVASAENTSTTASPRTVSVIGVAKVQVAQGSSATTATQSYRQGMEASLTDGQGKAEFLASKAGVPLGSVQSIVENGGSIECTGGEEAGEYVEYSGEQPDLPPSSSDGRVVAPLAEATAAKPQVSKPVKRAKAKKKKKPVAKKATATTCTLSTSVSLVYAIA
jgi:uncharacterized protein YggE